MVWFEFSARLPLHGMNLSWCALQALLGGDWADKVKAGWKNFSEQASAPSTLLSGAATATAAILLALPFNVSFPSNIAWV